MTKDRIHLLHKRYKTPQGRPREFWRKVMRDYGNEQKMIRESGYRWRIITFNDGRRELSYLRERKGGFFTGIYPAIYRGIIIPRLLTYGTFAHIKSITIAF